MKILVLGSGAGGGFPQWNCNCRLCAGQRQSAIRAMPRTQSSIAISADGDRWILLNASPDIGHQLRSRSPLHPRRAPRDTPIAAVVLMDAQIDHVAGLLSLREGGPLDIYATPCVLRELSLGLPILNVLQHYCGTREHEVAVEVDRPSAEFRIDGFPTLRFTALAIPGKAPPYSAHRESQVTGDNIALLVDDLVTRKRLFYAPGLAEVGERERRWMGEADCVLVDGTFWEDDEMARAGLGSKTAAQMGHLSQMPSGGRAGMVETLRAMPAARKVLIHINNSNPILDEDGAERGLLDASGIEVAHDGMEITL